MVVAIEDVLVDILHLWRPIDDKIYSYISGFVLSYCIICSAYVHP
jgi:hypothetical protein